MRRSNPVSREYDSFNPSHQAIYRPLTVVGWQPYRMTFLQRCGRIVRVALESVILFAFQVVPRWIGAGLKAAMGWAGARAQKPRMTTAGVDALPAVSARSGSATTTQQIRL